MSILFEQQVDVYWEYGTNSGNYPNITAQFTAEKGVPLEVDFTGLKADSRYYYRTRSRAKSASAFLSGPERTFNTQRAEGSTFSFTIEADEHLYDKKGVNSIFQICLDNQAADKPDFMFSLGDTFGDDHQPYTITSAQMNQLHKDYRPLLGTICHSVPFYFCIGNHEGEFNYYLAQNPPDNMGVYATLWRKFYYPNPYPNQFYTGNTEVEPYGMGMPENYYSWTWGDALFVVLDVYRYQSLTSAKPGKWDWTLGYSQYSWLKATLEGSNARYRFVFAHHTRGEGRGAAKTARYYEWGGYEADGVTWGFDKNRPGWDKPIHQLFVDNQVDIFFQGHDHLFAHEVLDGVVYQEVPMPSDSTYEIGMLANADAYLSDTIGGTGHLRVIVSPKGATVDFVRAWLPADTLSGIHHNREVAFSYNISNKVTAVENVQRVQESVKVFPNPASDKLSIVLSDNQENIQISLFSVSGQKVLETQLKEINLTGIPDGIYFLNIRTDKYSDKRKIVICH